MTPGSYKIDILISNLERVNERSVHHSDEALRSSRAQTLREDVYERCTARADGFDISKDEAGSWIRHRLPIQSAKVIIGEHKVVRTCLIRSDSEFQCIKCSGRITPSCDLPHNTIEPLSASIRQAKTNCSSFEYGEVNAFSRSSRYTSFLISSSLRMLFSQQFLIDLICRNCRFPLVGAVICGSGLLTVEFSSSAVPSRHVFQWNRPLQIQSQSQHLQTAAACCGRSRQKTCRR
jgi:hypothetical protein